MARSLKDMNEDERREYEVYKQILKNDLSRPEEREKARMGMDRLEWKGRAGDVYSQLDKFNERLSNIELIKKGGRGVATKKQIDELKEAIERLKTELAEESVTREKLGEVVKATIDDANGALVEAQKIGTANDTVAKEVQTLTGKLSEFMHKQAQKNQALDATDAKILKALGDIVSEAMDEAKTAIMAEAEAAAKEAVEKYMSDNK